MAVKIKTKSKTKTKSVVPISIKWFEVPQEHDYPAAESYLNLIYDVKTAAGFSQKL